MKNNLIGLTIGAAVAIIVLASVLVPVVDDAQKTASPVTVTNSSNEYMALSEGDVSVSLESGVLKVNGEIFTISNTDRAVLVTDYFMLLYNGANYYGSYISQASGIRNIIAVDVTVADGRLSGSVTYDNNTTLTATDAPVSFSLYIDPEGDWSVFDQRVTPSVYVSDLDDVIACGAYYTGTNKTFYWYYNGEASGIEAYDYDFTGTLTLADGYTDVYTASGFEYTISGETFTPYQMYVKKAINGHSTTGAEFNLLEVLPVIVIVGIIGTAVRGTRD